VQNYMLATFIGLFVLGAIVAVLRIVEVIG
jgi:hypothetical protein